MHELSASERDAYAARRLLPARAVFSCGEVAALRAAAEQVARVAQAALPGASRYAIDGNEYVEADRRLATTLQLEHAPGSHTLRVIEPFHASTPRSTRCSTTRASSSRCAGSSARSASRS